MRKIIKPVFASLLSVLAAAVLSVGVFAGDAVPVGDGTVLDEGSVWKTEEAVIIVKGAPDSAYTVSGAQLEPANGVIFQMVDDDGYAASGENAEAVPAADDSGSTTLILKKGASQDSVVYTGDIINGTGTQPGAAAGSLIVDIGDGVTLNGAVSSASSVYTVNDDSMISQIINEVTDGADVQVRVAEGAWWNVKSDSFIRGIINNGRVCIAEGAVLYIDGEAFTGEIGPGEFGDMQAYEAESRIDTSAWVIGENYQAEVEGKYNNIIIDGNVYYFAGSAEPVKGAGILDVAFTFRGWLDTDEEVNFVISEDYIETEQPDSNGESGGGEAAGESGGDARASQETA